ncbi:HD domain-containing protein [Deltaproteobacteria bacterium TL4]
MDSSKLEPIYEVRCPIHGSIRFNQRECDIIDHPFFQRLRHITQLGFASYVYSGATHSRFEHSLGVMHLAGCLFDHIVQENQKWFNEYFHPEVLRYYRHILRIAALLHDTGHSPYSHASETILPLKNKLELPVDWYKHSDFECQATHEDYSIAIVYAFSNSPPLLSSDEAQDVCSLIDSSIRPSEAFHQRVRQASDNSLNIHPLLKNIISGEIDADRMDYLLRDSYHVGVNYGKYDMDRMIQGLSCVQTEEGIMQVLDQNALYTYENYLLARLHMFLQVYFHKTLLPFDYYLQQAFKDQEIDISLTGTLSNFLAVRDDTVNSALWEMRDKKWASRIVFRQTAKRLFRFEHYHPPELEQEMLALLKKKGVDYLFLQSTGYLSKYSEGVSKETSPLYIKNKIMGEVVYRPVQDVSLLLEQYPQKANLKNLYCETKDYPWACEFLIPLLKSKKIL